MTVRGIGPAECARILGVSRQGFHLMRKRGDFPEPEVVIDGDKVGWLRETVERVATLRREGET